MVLNSMKKAGKNLSVVVLTVALMAQAAGDISVANAAAKPKLSKKSITLKVGETSAIKVKGKGIKKTTWSVDKKKVVSLSGKKKNGVKVKGVKKGNATVKAKIKAGKKTYNAKAKIKVTDANTPEPKSSLSAATALPSAASGSLAPAIQSPSAEVSAAPEQATSVPQKTTKPQRTETPYNFKHPTDVVEANIMSDMGGVTTEYSISQRIMVLSQINTGDWTKVSGVDCEGAKSISVGFSSETDKGSIEVYRDGKPGETGSALIATIPLKNTCSGVKDQYDHVSVKLSETLSGKHDIYFVFRGDGFYVSDWVFSKDEVTTKSTTVEETVVEIDKKEEAVAEADYDPRNPFQPKPEERQAYDAKPLKLTKSFRYGVLENSEQKVDSALIGHRFIADPTTIEYQGRLYVYGTTEEIEFNDSGKMKENGYNNYSLSCISSDDMVNWRDDGEIEVTNVSYTAHAWAPSVLSTKIDGKDKFFIYYTTGGTGVAMLEADSPTGPWRDPIGKKLIDSKTPTCDKGIKLLIDPAVFTDDDGAGYVYVGGGGGWDPDVAWGRVFKLSPDMTSVTEERASFNPSYYFEDNEINKFGDTYYYSYCTNYKQDLGIEGHTWVGAGVIAYYHADNPLLKNMKSGGMVFPNKGEDLYGHSYNNHHHMFTFKGETYICYHSTYLEGALFGTQVGNYRCLHIDKLSVDNDKKTLEADWTYEGAHLEPYLKGVR